MVNARKVRPTSVIEGGHVRPLIPHPHGAHMCVLVSGKRDLIQDVL